MGQDQEPPNPQTEKMDIHGLAAASLEISGVERTLSATCDAIMAKMRQLEDRLEEMDNRFKELSEYAEQTLNETKNSDDKEDKVVSERTNDN